MRSLILFAATLVLVSCSTTEAAGSGPADTPVRVMDVRAGERSNPLFLEGVTRAADRAVISLQQGGRLVERSVRLGDVVARGQPLARLDTTPWRNQLAASTARLQAADERIAQLTRDVARLTLLSERGSLPGADLESVQSQLRAATSDAEGLRIQRDEARRQLAEGTLTAPFAGTVTALHAEPGEVVAAGQPLIELAGAGLEVAVEVPESAWIRLSMNTEATVRLPALGVEVTAVIVDLAAAGATRGLFPVTVAFQPPARAVSGLTAEVVLALPEDPSLVVPIRAIVDPTGDRASVFRLQGTVVERVDVRLTGLEGNDVRLSGLAPGDQVVVAGHAQLIDGTSVAVQP